MKQEQLSRREALKLTGAGLLAASVSGWFGHMAARAAEAKPQGLKHKSCILLWMSGGPSQGHTFDLKDAIPYKKIDTAVSGIQISEYLPGVAGQMKNLALLRGMSTGEASHGRARYLMHTGYRQGAGGTIYPSLGSVISSELGDPNFELPNFVAVGGGSFGPGYLGPRFSPLVVNDAGKGVENLKPVGDLAQLDRKAELLDSLNKDLLDAYQANPIEAQQKGYQRAVQLMHSSKAKAFEIDQEPQSVRDAYGSSGFGKGCLLARRLVEAGVPFVEVVHGGWDTHGKADSKVKELSGQIDKPWATLMTELKERGLLDNTLVIWMGEFGRTANNGSNHFAKAWTTVLGGAGLKTGQVIGRTDKNGATVEERPISVTDFMATVCKALGIDPEKQYTARNGRPFRLVDKGAKLVSELF
jgi:hypothetical protein